MDGSQSISPNDLYARLGTASAPVLVDVRRQDSFSAADEMIIGAFHRSSGEVAGWAKDLQPGRQVVAYCNHGREASQEVAAALKKAGVQAAYLEGGIAAWKEEGLPTRKKTNHTSDKWVT